MDFEPSVRESGQSPYRRVSSVALFIPLRCWVINHYGGLSTYMVGSGELQRALLENEGLSFRSDGTIDLNQYQGRPGIRMIKKLKLPEEIAFQINARLPFSKERFK